MDSPVDSGAMAYVLKIKYADTLCRLIVKPHRGTGGINLSYDELEGKIRNLFAISSFVQLGLTYKDREDDVVTISQDEDLEDALVIQGLNPLRIDVNNREDGSSKNGDIIEAGGKKEARLLTVADTPLPVNELLKTLLPTIDSLKNIASGQLNHLNEKLEQEGKFSAKLFSEVLKAFAKEESKDSKTSFSYSKQPRCPYFQPNVFGRPACGNRGGFYGSYGRHDAHAFNRNNPFGKLDCRFVRDVTIFDGTELAPGTSFTKIWRLRNSGRLRWPQNTQLVHGGGDELRSVPVASLELPEGGLLPDGEIEASVDLTTPEIPGRYVSYWRLMAPSGVEFGHQVWVSLQGFTDKDLNRHLMFKNKGNLKHTVKELLQMYKDSVGKSKRNV